ncbi:hypothetical protein ABBQ38_009286 [Trebouxia sp. C0009 RCD-2024]
MLWQLLVLLRPFPALYLIALSFLEAVLVFQVGHVAGQYYLIIVDQQHSLFIRTSLISAALYVCNTIVKSTILWLSELLAYSWRGTLTRTLQQRYCQKEHFFWLSAHNDNPDQRITQDVNMFCNSLSSVARAVAAAPFQVIYYTYWTYSITSGYVVLAVYSFFLASMFIESAIIGPIARVVFRQERMEGNFRFAHMRLRTFLTELALYRAGAAEGAALEAALAPLLSNQLSLLMWRWLLTACTTGLEYTGALLNYTCIGLVVFTGGLPRGMDSGELAKWVSNASFATLTLIYSFTQLLDLASQFSTLAGVTLRVGQLLQELQTLEKVRRAEPPSFDATSPQEQVPLLGVITHDALSPKTPLHRQQQLQSPQSHHHTHPRSQNQPGSPQHVQPRHQSPLLAELQPPEVSSEHAALLPQQRQHAQQPFQALLRQGQHAQQRQHAQQPSQASSQHSSLRSDTFQEGAGPQQSSTLMGVSSDEAGWPGGPPGGGCPQPVVASVHDLGCERPDGKLLFQDVSFQVHPGEMVLVAGPSGCGKSTLVRALAGLWPTCQGQASLPLQHQASTGMAPQCGALYHSVLPPDCCSCSILPVGLHAWQVQITPQRPLAAPGGTLLEQVMYPSPLPSPGDLGDVDTSQLVQVLQQVGLAELLQRAHGDWMLPLDWQGMLSPGELQRLSFARILFHRPMLAVMDEPVSAVGSSAGIDLLHQLQQSGIAAIATGQIDSPLADPSLAAHLFSDIVLLHH